MISEKTGIKQEVLDEIVGLAKKNRIEKVILFGSRARVYTDQIEHTARRYSAWLPPIQCTLSGHQCMMIIQG